MIGMIIGSIFSLLFSLNDLVLGNIPFFTLWKFELYRIILSPLVGNSFFTIILAAMFFPVMGGRFENTMGSSSFLFMMTTLSILTNVLFCALTVLLSVIGTPEAVLWSCSGFWAILFALITIECMQNPDQPRRILFIPVDIPSKYYPLILYAFISLVSFNFSLGFALAIVVGYLHSKGYLDKLKMSSVYLQSLESGGLFHALSRNRGWVLAGTLGHDAYIPVNTVDRDSDRAAGGAGGRGAGADHPQYGRGAASAASFSTMKSTPEDAPGAAGTGNRVDEKKEAFPGTAHTMGGGGGGWSSSSSSSSLSRETLASKRLAALAQQQQQKQQDV